MCEPTTVMMIGSAVMGAVQQNQAAKAQTASNQRQYQNTVIAANANQAQANLAQVQESESAQQKLTENNQAARAATSTAMTAAGENGISGLSVDALLSELGTKQNTYNTSVMTNYDRALGGIQLQRDNVTINANSQINSLKAPAMPDYAGAALKAYSAYNKGPGLNTGPSSSAGDGLGQGDRRKLGIY